MATNKVENVILWCIVGPVAAYLGYRWLKSAWDNPPPEEYIPNGIEAELYMDDHPDQYPDFQMNWDG